MNKKYMLFGGVAAAFVLLYIVKKKGAAAGVGAAVGGAAVDLASGVVGGVSIGIGDLIGLPRVNETECEKAIREGRMWDASFVCPAGRFTKAVASESLNPASNKNVVNRGVEGIGEWITGNQNWTLGGQIYDWLHPPKGSGP